MRLYLVRHGETDMNIRHCYYGVTDVSLTKRGADQAVCLGRALAQIDFDRVIVSPLIRCLETAERIIGDRDIPFITDSRLQEQHFGVMEGMTYQEIMKIFPEEWEAWNCDFVNYRIPEGESFLDVRTRIDGFLQELMKDAACTQQENILLVAHKGTLGHILASLLHMAPEGYWNFVFEQGCYNTIDIEDGYAIIRNLNTPAG